jgi:K+-sensing histidine kinase KdpD
VRPFTDKQIELVTAFADQAAIAIENVRLFDEIQDKSRQLEEASQHKSQFLANMSHELRTPLNAILGYTELMADGAYGEPSEKMLGILKRLEANGKHLLGLINDVLDLSKIEAGQLVLELSEYCVEDIAQTVRSTLEPLASDKKLAFKVEMAPGLPSGRGDGRRLTQVLINLVGNAIKFTDAGEVAIKADANNGSFYVSVRDLLASPPPIKRGCFRNSSRPTMPSPRRRAAPAWGSPYRSALSRCTVAGFGSIHSPAKARRFLSRFPSSSSDRWSQHEQAYTGRRGPTG